MKLTPIAANQTEVELADGTTVFFSYKTPVAAHVPNEPWFLITDKYWSRTTTKHVRAFLRRYGCERLDPREVRTKPQSWFDALGAKS